MGLVLEPPSSVQKSYHVKQPWSTKSRMLPTRSRTAALDFPSLDPSASVSTDNDTRDKTHSCDQVSAFARDVMWIFLCSHVTVGQVRWWAGLHPKERGVALRPLKRCRFVIPHVASAWTVQVRSRSHQKGFRHPQLHHISATPSVACGCVKNSPCESTKRMEN